MNHSYFASLLENYRRRMEMDTSVLSLRKALYNSYQNESFKLKERQRQAMAKQRREQMQSEKMFRNRVKEIKAKGREIDKRYEHLRKPFAKDVKNKTTLIPESNVPRWPNNRASNWQNQSYYVVKKPPSEASFTKPHFHSRHSGKESSSPRHPIETKGSTEGPLEFPEISAQSMWSTEQRDNHVPHAPRKESFAMASTSDCKSIQEHKTDMICTPPSPINSNFTNYLINYYKNGSSSSLTNSGHSRPTLPGKKAIMSSCTLKYGKQSKHMGRRGPFSISLPDYEILVIDHEEEESL